MRIVWAHKNSKESDPYRMEKDNLYSWIRVCDMMHSKTQAVNTSPRYIQDDMIFGRDLTRNVVYCNPNGGSSMISCVI